MTKATSNKIPEYILPFIPGPLYLLMFPNVLITEGGTVMMMMMMKVATVLNPHNTKNFT